MEPKKKIRSTKFLEEMDRVLPWKRLCKLIEPHYQSNSLGRTKKPLVLMLKLYCLQQWYNLSDPGIEDAVYDRISFQRFLGIGEPGDCVPDETTILNFRHLLEEHKLPKKLFAEINRHLQEKGLLMQSGTIVDATLIAASGSTKNAEKKRDPEMGSTKKGDQYYFGMKAHIGVCTKGKPLVHSVECTSASVHDSQKLKDLLHGDESVVYGDKAYADEQKKEQLEAEGIKWNVMEKAKRGKSLTKKQSQANHRRSSVRAKVEFPFQIIKHLWGHRKVRYKGIYKNACQLYLLFGLANVFQVRRQLLRMA